MSKLKVAAVQFRLRAEPDVNAFLAHAEAIVDDAAAAGAELVLFPELVTTGLLASYQDAGALGVSDMGAAYKTVFPAVTDAFVHGMRSIAAARGITVLGGSHYRQAGDGGFRNTAYLFHPDGRTDTQDKLHLTPSEREMGTAPGEDVLVTRVGPFTVGVQVCADIEFPEVSRHLAKEGVTLLLAPSLTWNRRGASRVRYGAHARAMENQLYVAVSSLVGSSGLPVGKPLHGTGYATIVQPLDRVFGSNDGVVASAEDTREDGFVLAELDPELLQVARGAPEPPGFKWVREDLYDRLRRQRPDE